MKTPQLQVDAIDDRTAFINDGGAGYDVCVLRRLTAEDHGGDDNPEGLPLEEVEADLLTDEQWQEVLDVINDALMKMTYWSKDVERT